MKKFVIAAIAAVFAVTSFVGCTVSADADDIPLTEATVDLTTAQEGYNVEIKMKEDGKTPVTPLEIKASGYSQAAITLPYMGFKTAEITLTTTGKTVVGFLEKGASPWEGRMVVGKAEDGEDLNGYFWDRAIETKTTKTVSIVDGAAFITVGSNGSDNVITIDSIVLK